MSQIVEMTPAWVYPLFVFLTYIGFLQSRRREVSKMRLLVIPAAMTSLSAFSVWNAFGPSLLGFAAWGIALAMAILLNAAALRQPSGVVYDIRRRRYIVPGSWIPLTLIMAIFFAKYFVNAALMTKSLSAELPAFVVVASSIFGFLSGNFVARALHVHINGKLNATST